LCGVVIAFTVGCTGAPPSVAGENKEVVRNAFEIVAAGDYEGMGTVIADDYVRHSQATPGLVIDSLDDFKEFIRQDRAAIPDQKLELVHLVAEGDLVAFWGIYSGTQTGEMGPFPPTGKQANLDFAGIHRVADGKIVETWVTWDNIAFLSQLGLFPPPSPEQVESVEVSP